MLRLLVPEQDSDSFTSGDLGVVPHVSLRRKAVLRIGRTRIERWKLRKTRGIQLPPPHKHAGCLRIVVVEEEAVARIEGGNSCHILVR